MAFLAMLMACSKWKSAELPSTIVQAAVAFIEHVVQIHVNLCQLFSSFSTATAIEELTHPSCASFFFFFGSNEFCGSAQKTARSEKNKLDQIVCIDATGSGFYS